MSEQEISWVNQQSTIANRLVSRLGLEPRTPALKGQCSTVELPAHVACSQGLSFSNPAADGQDAAPLVIHNGKTPKGTALRCTS